MPCEVADFVSGIRSFHGSLYFVAFMLGLLCRDLLAERTLITKDNSRYFVFVITD
jgi:hypothetical protein